MRKSVLRFLIVSILLVSLLAVLPMDAKVPSVKAQEVLPPSIIDTVGTPINWTLFWQLFHTYALWDLEWYNGASWVSVKSDLTVIRNYSEPNHCKITLNFSASHAGSYRLTFAVNKVVQDYVNKTDKYQYELTYGNFTVTFDWSDCASISGLIFSHGLKDGYFWFRIRRDNVPLGAHVMIDPSVVAYVYYTTSMSYSRRNFWANGYFRQFYLDIWNYDFKYKGSSDGVTWNNLTTIAGAVSDEYVQDISTWLQNDTFVHLVFIDWNNSAPAGQKYTVSYQTATLGVGSISLGTRQTVCTLVGDRRQPTVTLDSNGYPWVGYTVPDAGTPPTAGHYVVRKATAKDGSSWSSETELFTFVSTSYYMSTGVIVPLANGKMYAVWEDSHPYEPALGRLYNGASWEANKTIRPAFDEGGDSKSQCRFSVVVKSNFDIVYYHDQLASLSNNGTHAYTYSHSSDSWSYTKWVSTQGMVGCVTINKTTDDMWFFYTHTHTGSKSVGDGIYYRKYTNSTNTWGSEVTVNSTITSLSDLHGFYQQSSGRLGVAYVVDDYLYFIAVTENKVPTNDALTLDLTGASYKGTKTLLPAKQDYKFVYNCSDAEGVTDISYAEIRLDYSSKNVILRATRGTGDSWTFAEQSDPSDYVTLNTGGSSHSTSGTQKTFNFLVKINWNWGDSAETIGVRAYVIDSQSASDQDDYTNIFGVESHLASSSLAVDDYRVNPSQTLTFSGYWKYNGTTIVPPDSDYQVKIKLSGTQKGSTDTTLVSGAFSISDVTAETTVNSYSYTVEASYNTSVGSFSAVIVDRAVITITANTTSPSPSANVNFTLTAIYDYDDTPITSWTVNTYRNSTHFASGNFTDGGYTDIFYVYTVENVSESTYDLTAFTSNTVTVYWSTYVALTIKTLDLDSNVLTEAIVYFNSTQITVDSNGYATKTGIEKNENITVKVYWHGIKVNGTWTTNMTETKTIEADCNVWSITVNARDADGTVLSLSETKFVWNFPNGTQINTTKSDGSWIFKIMNGTHYYKIFYQGQWISENVTLPIDSKNVTVINKNCWAYRLTVYVTNQNGVEMSGATLTLTRSDNASLASYGLTPKTVDYYNTTHGRYVWTQLANQTSSYTIKATSGSDSNSTTTALTENTQKTIVIATTISGGPGGPSGGPSLPPVQPPPSLPPIEVPQVPGEEFNYGIIVLVGVVGIAATVAVVGRGTPSLESQWKEKTRFVSVSPKKWKKTRHLGSSGKWPKRKTHDLSRKWRRKRS